MSRMVEVEWKDGTKTIKSKAFLYRQENKTRIEVLRELVGKHMLTIRPLDAEGPADADPRERKVTVRRLEVLELQTSADRALDLWLEVLLAERATPAVLFRGGEFLKQDCDHVYQQNVDRQHCGMQIFVATMAAMVTSGFALIGMVKGFGGLSQARQWLMVGVGIPIGVLTVAIFVAIQKQRTRNSYEGLLVALRDHYHTDTERMCRFRGWLNATKVFDRCQNVWGRGRAGGCDRQSECIQAALKEALEESRGVPLVPSSILSTFNGFAATVYTLLYLMLAAILIKSADFRYGLLQESRMHTALAVTGAIILISVLAVWGTDPHPSRPWKQDFAPLLKAINFVSFAFAIVFNTCWIVLRILALDVARPWVRTVMFTGVLFTIVYFGARLFMQAYHLRKGRHSFDAYRRMWAKMLETCPLMFHPPGIGKEPTPLAHGP